jgi:hypothetical protein
MKKPMQIRKIENFHILLWLLKDLCWVTLSKTLGVIMIVPTLSLAIYITWKNRKDKAELVHNLAVCFWITANSVWMLGEFYLDDDSARTPATVFFVIGLLMMARYYFTAISRLPASLKDLNRKE